MTLSVGAWGAATQEMPFDLAFSRATLGYDERASISADGKLLAYTIHTPPAKSPTESRYLPSGAPSSVLGHAIFVTTLGSDRHQPVGPKGANCWRPAFSPDAARVAFYCDVDNVVNLWVHDLKQGEARKVSDVKIKAKLWAGDEPVWGSGGKEVFVPLTPANVTPVPDIAADAPAGAGGVQVRVHRAGREAPKEEAATGSAQESKAHYMRENNAAMGAIDVASGAVRIVAPADAETPPSVLQLSPTGKWLAYLSVFHKPTEVQTESFQDLAVVPAAGGTIRTVARDLILPSRDYHLDVYAWHSTRDQLFWIKDKQLWTVDLSGGTAEPRRLASELNDVTGQPIVAMRDGKSVIVGVRPLDLHDYRDPHPQALAIVPLEGGAARIVNLPKGFVFSDVIKQSASTAWQPQADAITVVGRDSASVKTTVMRIDLKSGQVKTLWQGLAKLNLVGAPRDHGSLIAAFEDINTPVDYYRFDTALTNKKRLTQIEPRLAGIGFGPVETFTTVVPQFDGSVREVSSAVMLPAGAKRGDKLPGIAFLYPGGNRTLSAAEFGGGSPATVPVSIFTTRGYAVLLVEMPIGPDGKPGNPVSEMVDVLVPQVHHAAQLGYTDIRRMAVSGQSYGGYGTASVISGTDIFRGAVAISGAYDLAGGYAWMGRDGGNGAARWSETGQGRMGTHPWGDLQRYLNNSPYYRADRIHTPLLMLHGQIDDACPVEDARKMFNALKRLDRTVQMAEYANEGHVIYEWSTVNAADAAQRMVEFLDRYVRGPVQ